MKLNVTKERNKIKRYQKNGRKITDIEDLRIIFGSASIHHLVSLRKIKLALSQERIVDGHIHAQLNAAIKRSELEIEVSNIVHKFVTAEVYDKFCKMHNKGRDFNYKDFLAYSTKMMNETGIAKDEDYKKVLSLRQERHLYNPIIHKKR